MSLLQTEVDMGPRTRSKASRDKVRADRKLLRQQGLRPIQIWVPVDKSEGVVKGQV